MGGPRGQTGGAPERDCSGIVDALETHGWVVQRGFLSQEDVGRLAHECLQLWNNGVFKPAGVGRGKDYDLRPDIRSDEVMWLEQDHPTLAQRTYLDALEQLRQAINERLFLGLFDFEGHFALYPPGSFYRKHLDQFHGVEARTVTCVLYLNQGWTEADGGQLRLYLGGEDHYVDVQPEGGTLACFLSGRFVHEVLPAKRERLSVTGWFKRRDGAIRL